MGRVLYAFLFFVFVIASPGAFSQTINCGVTARIYPGNTDSVVYATTPITFFATGSVNASSFKWIRNGLPTGQTGSSMILAITPGVHTIQLVAINGACTDTSTVIYFNPGTAHSTDEVRWANYGYPNVNTWGTAIDDHPDGGFVFGGRSMSLPCGTRGYLVKLAEKGCVDWSKVFRVTTNCGDASVKATLTNADSSVYAIVEYANQTVLVKLNKHGQYLWSYTYKLPGAWTVALTHLATDNDGNIYSTFLRVGDGAAVLKINSSGALSWARLLNAGGTATASYLVPRGIQWNNGKLYISGGVNSVGVAFYDFVCKLDAATGQTEWQYRYDEQGQKRYVFGAITSYGNNLLITGVGGAANASVHVLTPDGDITQAVGIDFPNTGTIHKATKAFATTDNKILLMQWREETMSLQPGYAYHTRVVKFDVLLNKLWGINYTNYERGYLLDAALNKNNSLGAIGVNFGLTSSSVGAINMRFLKVDTVKSTQNDNCTEFTTDYNLVALSPVKTAFTLQTDAALQITQFTDQNLAMEDAFIHTRRLCPDYLDSCSYVKLSGPLKLCNYNTTYTYRLNKNRKCGLTPQLSLSPGVTLISSTDTTVTVKFAGYGSYRLSAVLNSCVPQKDSLTVTIAPGSAILELGNDTSLCPNSSIRLSASRHFKQYIWQDGSTDSVFTVNMPGQYRVLVTDLCGNTQTDTINVSDFSVAVNIGADRFKCNNDTLQLHASPGFISYTWFNNYQINNVNSQHVVVNPLVDTIYYVRAEKLPGCFAYDTVRVTVRHAPGIALGSDTSLCEGQSLMLQAPPGFQHLLWNSGSQQQQLMVNAPGIYHVTGTTIDGCKSFDTLQVAAVWPLPGLNIVAKDPLCTGATITLDAGSFASYRWHDGSTGQTFTAPGLGQYFVTVTDLRSCSNADTFHINSLFPIPQYFLGNDTAICSYGTIELKSTAMFSRYTWSTGSNTSTINISGPGNYHLTVTDFNGCTGADTVKVALKQCMQGLYVPSAFSPNKDGLNDRFGALLFGNVIQFHFKVFNRFGEVVFETNDTTKSWDGTINGIPQPAGTFVWLCHYQLAGESPQVAKGTVLLII